MDGEGVNQVNSCATNGNALTVNGGVSGTIAGRDVNNHQTTNVNINLDQSEAGRDVVGGDQVTATNYAQVGELHGNLLIGHQQPENPQRDTNELCIELRKELEVSLNNYEDDNEAYSLILSRDQLQHWSYCDPEKLKTLSRNEISNEIYEQNISSVDLKLEITQSDNKSVITLVGPPMVGKTRLIKSVAGNFLENNVFDYIFYCDLAFLQKTFSTNKVNLFDFLTLNKKPKKWMNDVELCLDVLEKIVENNKILILFDNFDILNLSYKDFYQVNCFNETKAENFVMNILLGEVLPQAKKVVISKHYNLDKLKIFLKNKIRFVNVCGINHQTQLDLIQKRFPHLNCNNLDQLIVKDLWSFCFVPYIFRSFIEYCHHNIDSNLTTSFAFTITFLKFFGSLKENYEQNFDLLKLADFAFEQYFEIKMCFDQTELKKSNLSDSLIHSFFTALPYTDVITGLPHFGTKSHFNHILVHEFLVALKLILLPKKDFEKYFSKLIATNNNCIVIKFVFGICDTRLIEDFKIRFSQKYLNLIENKKVLKSSKILKKLKKQATTDFCDYVNEMCDECFAKSVLKQFNLTLFVNGNNSYFLSFKD